MTANPGRVSKVSGELKLETKDRNMYQQRKAVEIKDGLKKIEESGGDYDDIIEALELFGLEATLRM